MAYKWCKLHENILYSYIILEHRSTDSFIVPYLVIFKFSIISFQSHMQFVDHSLGEEKRAGDMILVALVPANKILHADITVVIMKKIDYYPAGQLRDDFFWHALVLYDSLACYDLGADSVQSFHLIYHHGISLNSILCTEYVHGLRGECATVLRHVRMALTNTIHVIISWACRRHSYWPPQMECGVVIVQYRSPILPFSRLEKI